MLHKDHVTGHNIYKLTTDLQMLCIIYLHGNLHCTLYNQSYTEIMNFVHTNSFKQQCALYMLNKAQLKYTFKYIHTCTGMLALCFIYTNFYDDFL